MSAVVPLHDNVVVRKYEPQETSPGGIVLPYIVRDIDNYTRGKVVAVGLGRQLDNGQRVGVALHEGDEILFRNPKNRFSNAVDITVAGDKLFIIPYDDVGGIIQ